MRYHVRILAGRVDRGAGSHIYHQELVRRLAARGHRVSLVCFEAVQEVLECAKVFVIPKSPGPPGRFVWRLAPLIEYRHCSRRLNEEKLEPADVVVAGEHLFLKAHAQMFRQTPWIYLPHSLIISQEIQSYQLPTILNWVARRSYTYLQRWALNHADQTLRFTHLACRLLSEHYGHTVQPHFFVNPIGIELPSAPAPTHAKTPVRLLFVGRLVRSKNVGFLLKSLASLRHLPWQLDIVGDGEQRPYLEALVRSLDLGDRVSFHGHQDDPRPWYRRADFFPFPSKLESCGIALLEAMSYGVPPLIVKTDGVNYVSAAQDLLDHGQTGLVAQDEDDFRRLLASILQCPTQRIPLGRAAQARVANLHTWEKHIERYEELFDELIHPRRYGSPSRMEPRVSRTNS